MSNNTPKEMYLEMLKKAILFEIWLEHEPGATKENRFQGLDWPLIAHSMIGRIRMNHLHQLMNAVVNNNIEGDFIETGVWRGGTCIFMRGFLKVNGITNRKVIVADSFEGLPAPEARCPIDETSKFHEQDFLRVSLPEVVSNFQKYDLYDDGIIFLKGWFKDTLPAAPTNKIAIARLDGDMYSSTMDALTHLYPKVAIGGFIVIDDYSIGYCAAAVTDFRNAYHITDPLVTIDSTGVYWKKTK
ncbi:macrocin O-methyltransferase [Paenibacillus sp. BIHB 4019]|uniref:Macrocin O-methyltransferase n=1 Tax=Paenibacillus sp. BIHB 4019 TaxID=1870819 RepID=A0A1B2DMK1_9BACL|nr:TylF/MycF family methyltransferase [Paenibacillus sp. BIHB 4019]ANY68943.1 macrocin O-methyltransferase [Paenibacillus sp. BIHB 4019]